MAVFFMYPPQKKYAILGRRGGLPNGPPAHRPVPPTLANEIVRATRGLRAAKK